MANLSTVCTIMWGKWRQNLHSRLFLCLFDYLKWNILLVLINTFSDKLIMTFPLFPVDISHNETTMHGILKLNWYCFFKFSPVLWLCFSTLYKCHYDLCINIYWRSLCQAFKNPSWGQSIRKWSTSGTFSDNNTKFLFMCLYQRKLVHLVKSLLWSNACT